MICIVVLMNCTDFKLWAQCWALAVGKSKNQVSHKFSQVEMPLLCPSCR